MAKFNIIKLGKVKIWRGETLRSMEIKQYIPIILLLNLLHFTIISVIFDDYAPIFFIFNVSFKGLSFDKIWKFVKFGSLVRVGAVVFFKDTWKHSPNVADYWSGKLVMIFLICSPAHHNRSGPACTVILSVPFYGHVALLCIILLHNTWNYPLASSI